MMMGPTKKKVFTAGFVCFLIPVILGTLFFFKYKKETDAKIAELQVKSQTESRYAFVEAKAAGEVITPEDVALVEVKYESDPEDSFGEEDFDSLINRRVLIDAEANTVITNSMLYPEADPLPNKDIRLQEFNMFTLPSDVQEGDFLDFRVTLPGGENYIIVSGKEVKKIGEGDETNTVFVELNEEEIIRTTAALIESYMTVGCEVYANKYVKPNVQLFKSQRVNLPELTKETFLQIEKEKETALSGEGLTMMVSGERKEITELPLNGVVTTPSGDVTIINGQVLVTNAQVAKRIGVDTKIIDEVVNVIESKDETKLAQYDHWLLKTPLSMENTYPVKPAIAQLILNNPNILQDLSAKYDIAKLEAERSSILELPLYEMHVDDYTGEITIEEKETLQRIESALNEKIELQKTERKEYLQYLLMQEQTGSSET